MKNVQVIFLRTKVFTSFRGDQREIYCTNNRINFKLWPSIKSGDIINEGKIDATHSTTVWTILFRLADFLLRTMKNIKSYKN